jgi:hypothetical protein
VAMGAVWAAPTSIPPLAPSEWLIEGLHITSLSLWYCRHALEASAVSAI